MASDREESPEELLTEPEEPNNIFTNDNGEPRTFYFHKSITHPSRPILTSKIEAHGGIVVNDDRGVDTILIAIGEKRAILRSAYVCHPKKKYQRTHVEFANFIDDCINRNSFEHEIYEERRPMPGVPPGTGRNKFTEEEDEKLCLWLAYRMSDYNQGGRSGLKVYEHLIQVARECPHLHGWALNHTAQSFKERYKKNKDRFNERIDIICKSIERVPDQLHPQTRNLNNIRREKKRKPSTPSDSEEDEEEEEEEEDDEPRPDPAPQHSYPRRDAKMRQSTRTQPIISRKREEKATGDEEEELEDVMIPEDIPPTYRTQDPSGRRVSKPPPAMAPPAGKPIYRPISRPPQVNQVASSSQLGKPRPRPIPKRGGPLAVQHSLPTIGSPSTQPPYRNTRARSRSVDPTSAPSLPPPAKRQRNVPLVVEQPIQEEEAQTRESSPYEDVFTAPMPETVADEMDVANLLTTSIKQTQSVVQARRVSMETDDLQTRNQIFGTASSSLSKPNDTRSAAELLKEFEEASEVAITPAVPLRVNRPLNKFQIKNRLHDRPPQAPRAGPSSAQPPPPYQLSTPLNAIRGRGSGGSDSSVATEYPASGTRASALKKDLRRKEMMIPYKPPPGTRADMMSQ